jgi:deoxyribose-phosphate aldolase
VYEDICRVVKASRPAIVKVILETGALDDEEKIVGCTLSKLAGAAFVKTSTGFGRGGATVEDIALMRKIVGAEMGVKASGGVRSADDAAKMAMAGANRLGASASVAIVTGDKQAKRASGY